MTRTDVVVCIYEPVGKILYLALARYSGVIPANEVALISTPMLSKTMTHSILLPKMAMAMAMAMARGRSEEVEKGGGEKEEEEGEEEERIWLKIRKIERKRNTRYVCVMYSDGKIPSQAMCSGVYPLASFRSTGAPRIYTSSKVHGSLNVTAAAACLCNGQLNTLVKTDVCSCRCLDTGKG